MAVIPLRRVVMSVDKDTRSASRDEEHHAALVSFAELPVDAEPEDVPVEAHRAIEVDRAQQDTARENLHAESLPQPRWRRWSSS